MKIASVGAFFGGSGGADSDDDDADRHLFDAKNCLALCEYGTSGETGVEGGDAADNDDDEVLGFGDGEEREDLVAAEAASLDGVGGNV